MAGQGGYRPGSGAKKNQHRIACGELRKAIEDKLGMPYQQMLAETQLKLFNDFKNDINVRDYIRFTENMSNRILVNQDSQVVISDISELSKEDIQGRIDNLLTRAALAKPAGNVQDVKVGGTD